MGGGERESSLASLSILQEIAHWASEVTRLKRLRDQVTCPKVNKCLEG
jgi:hypothetical protein